MLCTPRRCCVCLLSCPPAVGCMLGENETIGLPICMCLDSREGNVMVMNCAYKLGSSWRCAGPAPFLHLYSVVLVSSFVLYWNRHVLQATLGVAADSSCMAASYGRAGSCTSAVLTLCNFRGSSPHTINCNCGETCMHADRLLGSALVSCAAWAP